MTDIPIFWVALLIIVIAYLWMRRARSGSPRRGRGRPAVDVEGDLLRACGGDKATVERLIRHELDRKPKLSRIGAALMALSRLRDDQR